MWPTSSHVASPQDTAQHGSSKHHQLPMQQPPQLLHGITPPQLETCRPASHAAQVRGANSAVEELSFILRHSQSRALVVDDPQLLDKLLPHLSSQGSASSNGSSNVRSSVACLLLPV